MTNITFALLFILLFYYWRLRLLPAGGGVDVEHQLDVSAVRFVGMGSVRSGANIL
jgi:hypothetical protein